jgi:hypothetical protein
MGTVTVETTPVLAFKDLCIDSNDPQVMADFYAAALGLPAEALDDGDYRLSGEQLEETIWVNRVPEKRTVKQRVHIDVDVAAVDDLIALGATVVDKLPHWTLMADPEGGEVCAFVRESVDLDDYRLYELVVDAADHVAITRWWADRLGGRPEHDQEQEFSWIEGVPGLPFGLVFQQVPEPKTVKNRIHWDVVGRTDDVLAAGATVLRSRDSEIDWDVLADPEGNEFCVFAPE